MQDLGTENANNSVLARRVAAGGAAPRGLLARGLIMPSPPIKSLDFRGFDSSRLLILRVGNSHVR